MSGQFALDNTSSASEDGYVTLGTGAAAGRRDYPEDQPPSKRQHVEAKAAVKLPSQVVELESYDYFDTVEKQVNSKSPNAIKVITEDDCYFMIDEAVLRYSSEIFNSMLGTPTSGDSKKTITMSESSWEIAPLFKFMVQLECFIPTTTHRCVELVTSLHFMISEYACKRLEPVLLDKSIHMLEHFKGNADHAWDFVCLADKLKSKRLFKAAVREMKVDHDTVIRHYTPTTLDKAKGAKLGYEGFFRYVRAFGEADPEGSWDEVAKAWEPAL